MHIILNRICVFTLIIFIGGSCTKDQNTFLPNRRVNFSTTQYEFNFLTISGNSVKFEDQGVNGIIVVCVDPNSSLYFAYDATCPYETDYSGVVIVQPVKNYVSPPFRIFSQDFYGVCNKCKSKFNLMAGGQYVSGPASHYLQNYHVIIGFQNLTITN